MEVKLKVGLYPIVASYMLELMKSKKDSEILNEMYANIDSMIKIINKKHDVVFQSIATTLEDVNKIKEHFQTERVDLIIVVNMTFSEDQFILNILKEFKYISVVIWSYSLIDFNDSGMSIEEFMNCLGPCGTFQSLPAVFRMKRKVKFIFGKPDKPEVQKKLNDFLDVNLTIKKLKNTHIALMPYRWDAQTDTMVDEFKLTNIFGPEVTHHSYHELKKFIDRVKVDEVRSYFRDVKSKYKIEDVRDEVIEIAVKTSLALRDFASFNKINAISYNELSPDLLEIIGLHPCIYLEDLYKTISVFGNEGDLVSITALLMFRYLTDDGIMFTEFYAPSTRGNFILIGHQGNHNLNNLIDKNSDVRIVQDYELRDSEFNINNYEGAWMYFVPKKGEVTLSQLIFFEHEFKLIYFKGESLGKKIIDFYAHAAVKVPINIDDFIYRIGAVGCGHHWMMAYGDFRGQLKDLAYLLEIESIDIEEFKIS
jgi:L-arabinose isomerase